MLAYLSPDIGFLDWNNDRFLSLFCITYFQLTEWIARFFSPRAVGAHLNMLPSLCVVVFCPKEIFERLT